MADPSWGTAAAPGFCQPRPRLVELQTVCENAIVTSVDQRDQTWFQRQALLARKVRHVAGAAQQALHLASPVLFLDLDQRLQFPQMVRVAQCVPHAGHRVVGLPVRVSSAGADAPKRGPVIMYDDA